MVVVVIVRAEFMGATVSPGRPINIPPSFTGRMVNERMNMEEISREVAALPAGTDPKKLILLSKQAHDEAKHFQFVKEVVEYLKGEEIDMQKAVESHAKRLEQKGAAMIKKYNCNDNPLMLGLYQLLAEGRAARNWGMMAKCITDPFISSRYAKIALRNPWDVSNAKF